MIQYATYGLLLLYSAILLRQGYVFIAKKKPAGPDSAGWVLGIIYTGLLGGIVLIVTLALIYGNQTVALLVAGIPMMVALIQRAQPLLRDAYARFPSRINIPLLQLAIHNLTPWKVHLKIECFFGSEKSGQLSLHQTFDYFIDPDEMRTENLSRYETSLVAIKSGLVVIHMFEQVFVKSEARSFWYEVQPCFNVYDEKPEAFRNGIYAISIAENKEMTLRNGRNRVIESLGKHMQFTRGGSSNK